MEVITYKVLKHGLLWKVGFWYNSGSETTWTTDSSWEDESKAIEHCRLLNEQLNAE